jgi:TonB-dependent SusC/RagA subfamily outer membrane receptor
LVAFFARKEKISRNDLEEIVRLIEKKEWYGTVYAPSVESERDFYAVVLFLPADIAVRYVLCCQTFLFIGYCNLLAIVSSDIVSINILKGEAAEKLYGLKGKNGVICITTKNKQ